MGGPTCCASAAAEARGKTVKIPTILRAEGGQLQAPVGRRPAPPPSIGDLYWCEAFFSFANIWNMSLDDRQYLTVCRQRPVAFFE